MKKPIITICLSCGNKHDRKHKGVMGAWIGDCDMCGEKNVSCASAPHDFGIYESHEQKLEDEVQDAI